MSALMRRDISAEAAHDTATALARAQNFVAGDTADDEGRLTLISFSTMHGRADILSDDARPHGTAGHAIRPRP